MNPINRNRNRNRNHNHQAGFSLIELMITLVIGLVMSGLLGGMFISSRQAETINQQLGILQEDARFVISLMRQDLQQAGMYDDNHPDLNGTIDPLLESPQVRNNAVVLTGSIAGNTTLTSVNDDSAAGDVLVIARQSDTDCAGRGGGASGAIDGQIGVLNLYTVENNSLSCEGLLVQDPAASNGISRDLVDTVARLDILYGVSDGTNGPGVPTAYVTSAGLTDGQSVISLQVGLLMRSQRAVGSEQRAVRILDHTMDTPDDGHLYIVVEDTIHLRNNYNRLVQGG